MKPETMRNWIGALGGRRWLLTVGGGLVSSILVWFGKITSGDFTIVTIGTVGAYIAGSTYQKAKGVPDAEAD